MSYYFLVYLYKKNKNKNNILNNIEIINNIRQTCKTLCDASVGNTSILENYVLLICLMNINV